jgi:hypothetical protein
MIENSEKPCKHEYVKIFQRKYKNFGRRLVSTRGYLPTGFSNKDFSFLTGKACCFCTKCRKKLFPTRNETIKPQNINLPAQITNFQPGETADNIWTEEIAEANPNTSQEIAVEELQIEPTDVSEIVDKEIAVNQQNENAQEDGEA